MKKLMTVIAAVAMSFGLFADATAYKISFEGAEGCMQGEALNKTEWTVPEGATATVIERTLGYNYQGKDARRTDLFEDTNLNSLKLETGTDKVVCTPGNVADGIFFDQVVKFTGYEEPPTVTDSKIAVWMKAIDGDDTEAGETNMYITCGTVALGGAITSKTINLGPADIDATHRVTIKSLGKVADGVEGAAIAGFIVYIDGVQVVSEDAMGIVADAQILEAFASYNASGMLFPALEAGTVATVAYQGIGEIDDLVVDDQGPEFARYSEVEGTVVAINGATLVLTVDGEEVTVGPDGKFKVAPNSKLLFTYTAIDGNFLTGGSLVVTKDGDIAVKTDYDFSGEIESKKAIAKFMDDSTMQDKFFASLSEAVNAAGDEAEIKLVADANENVTIAADKNVVINLNDFTLKGVNTSYVINNNGTLILGGGTVGNDNAPQNTLIRNGANAYLEITDGTYLSKRICIKNDENGTGTGGTLVIQDGTFGSESTDEYNWDVILNWGNATINGGVFNGLIESAAAYDWNAGNTVIYGGTFNAKVLTVKYFNGDTAAVNEPSLKVYGGTFNDLVFRNIGPYSNNPNPDDFYNVDVDTLPEPYASAANKGVLEIYPAGSATIDEEEVEWEGGMFIETAAPAVNLIVNTPAEGYRNAWVPADEGYVTAGEELIPTETYDITIAEVQNGTLETSVTNDVAAGTTVTVTATPAEGFKVKVITVDGAEIEGITFVMPDKDVTVAAEFEKEAEEPQVAPGGSPVNVKTEEDIAKVKINAKSPDTNVISDEDYSKYFKKNAVKLEDGTYNVSAVLDETAIEFPKSVEDLGEKIGEIAAGAEEVTIAAKPGLYYYVEEANDVTKIAEPERNRVMATGTTVTIPTTKFEKSGFYRLNCSPFQRGTLQ